MSNSVTEIKSFEFWWKFLASNLQKRTEKSEFNFKLTSVCDSFWRPLGSATNEVTWPVNVIPVTTTKLKIKALSLRFTWDHSVIILKRATARNIKKILKYHDKKNSVMKNQIKAKVTNFTLKNINTCMSFVVENQGRGAWVFPRVSP